MVAGVDERTHNVECYNCCNYRHYASQCLDTTAVKNTGVDLLQKGVLLVQSEGTDNVVINKDWILLDTCSTDSVCNNRALVRNICNATPTIVLRFAQTEEALYTTALVT